MERRSSQGDYLQFFWIAWVAGSVFGPFISAHLLKLLATTPDVHQKFGADSHDDLRGGLTFVLAIAIACVVYSSSKIALCYRRSALWYLFGATALFMAIFFWRTHSVLW